MRRIVISALSVFISGLSLFAQPAGWSDYFVTPEMFGCVSGDSLSADTNSDGLQRAIDYAEEKGLTLVSSAGKKYYISKGVTVKKPLNIDFGRAMIVATDNIRMITFDTGANRVWKGDIENIRLNMNSKAICGIYCNAASKFHFSNCEITGIKSGAAGFEVVTAYELFVDNFHFHGAEINSTGILMHTSDCHFSDCVMIDCYTAIENAGMNFFSRMHAWMTAKYIKGSTFYKTKGGIGYLSQCYSDTFDYGFVIESPSKLHISQLYTYHNPHMWIIPKSEIDPEIFHFADAETASKSNVTLLDSVIPGIVVEGDNRQIFSNYKIKNLKQFGNEINVWK